MVSSIQRLNKAAGNENIIRSIQQLNNNTTTTTLTNSCDPSNDLMSRCDGAKYQQLVMGMAMWFQREVSNSQSTTCLEYQVVGICYWLLCTNFGCKVRTSAKVRHYVPDAVVSAYSSTGMNPWVEMSPLGSPNPMAQAGEDGTTHYGIVHLPYKVYFISHSSSHFRAMRGAFPYGLPPEASRQPIWVGPANYQEEECSGNK